MTWTVFFPGRLDVYTNRKQVKEMVHLKNYCVYMHIGPNNKKYVGITGMNPKKRWQNGDGYKNQVFYSAIKKYGWDNFQHIIIARGLNKDEAEWLEIELIRINDSTNQDKGYNISSGGNGANGVCHKGEMNPMYGKHHTGESKSKSSKSNIGKNQPKAKPVVCITTKRLFEGVRVASRYYNVDHSMILKCCKRKQKVAGSYNDQKLIWRYVNYKHNRIYRIKKGA